MRPFNPGEDFQNIITTALPGFVKADYDTFVEFIKSFAAFLDVPRTFTTEQVFPEYGQTQNTVTQQITTAFGGPAYEIRKLLEYKDIATSLDEFKAYFLSMFAKNFPQFSYVPADLLIRSLHQFYQSKGTTDSIEWFFRVFFNEPANVYFPREDILKASDGTWEAPITLKVSTPLPDPTTTIRPDNSAVPTFYTGQRIETTTGSAQVESVVTTIVGQAFNQRIIINELTLKFGTVLGTFSSGQIVHNIDSTTQIYTTILPVISDTLIESGGSNYAPGDVVVFSEGPTGGGGFGAAGIVETVASTALNGVQIDESGDGYIVGDPVTFISTTGSGAAAVVSAVINGLWELEDGTGFCLAEDSTSTSPNYVILEDKNTFLIGLSIDPFVNATSNVVLSNTDWGVSSGVAAFDGVNLDGSIEIALDAGDDKPFMHPWVFTNPLHTTVALANAATTLVLTGNTFFGNGIAVFAITSQTDSTTNLATATITANTIVSDLSTGPGIDVLYLKQIVGGPFIVAGKIFKQDGTGTAQLGTIATTAGSANVVGTNTIFSTLSANTHLRFDDGSHNIIRTVVNNTFLETFTPVGNTLAANTFSAIPTGLITLVDLQAQKFYGKIRQITMISSGDNYQTLPVVASVSVDAQAQQIDYLDPDPTGNTANNQIVASNGQVQLYEPAILEALQSAGQVAHIRITNSGVGYTDANSIIISVLHSSGRTGANADVAPIFGAITQYPGIFTTTQGFLSANKFLEDASFYNEFTYVVRVAESFDRYKQILLHLLHPAGFQPLGQFVETQVSSPAALSAEELLTTS